MNIHHLDHRLLRVIGALSVDAALVSLTQSDERPSGEQERQLNTALFELRNEMRQPIVRPDVARSGIQSVAAVAQLMQLPDAAWSHQASDCSVRANWRLDTNHWMKPNNQKLC